MTDSRDPLELPGRQALAVQEAALELTDRLALLALAVQTAWVDLWVLPALRASEDFRAGMARQERTARLVRRGIPEQLARQGLRVL